MKRFILALFLLVLWVSPVSAEVAPVRTVNPVNGNLYPESTENSDLLIGASSDPESIRYIQLMLSGIGAISEGEVTGKYDVNTATAVSNFQKWANANQCDGMLSETGWVDYATLKELEYAYDHDVIMPTPIPAPTPTLLPALDFDAVNRNPDKYKHQSFLISGRVLQVIEEYDEEEKVTYVSVRIATDGNYDDIIFVVYKRESGEDRILEGDNVTFEGTAYGLFSYTSIDDVPITLPLFYLDRVVSIE